MATKEEQALQTLTTYFDRKTGNVPAAMAVLEQAVKERAELLRLHTSYPLLSVLTTGTDFRTGAPGGDAGLRSQ
jgi:hypothetical protein